MTRWLLTLVVLGLPLAHGRAADPVDYVRDVKPILRERCYSATVVMVLDTTKGTR